MKKYELYLSFPVITLSKQLLTFASLFTVLYRPCSTMDSIRVSEAPDPGSIPGEATLLLQETESFRSCHLLPSDLVDILVKQFTLLHFKLLVL